MLIIALSSNRPAWPRMEGGKTRLPMPFAIRFVTPWSGGLCTAWILAQGDQLWWPNTGKLIASFKSTGTRRPKPTTPGSQATFTRPVDKSDSTWMESRAELHLHASDIAPGAFTTRQAWWNGHSRQEEHTRSVAMLPHSDMPLSAMRCIVRHRAMQDMAFISRAPHWNGCTPSPESLCVLSLSRRKR